ncbi:hypothetical protein E2562_032822 [Oryza meyeriana var. granulata]|uniref:Uncharacterized protein n=1 Tax=Oryza meyeriana var. granulata TaxID=110450 RepID=A0A6G1DQX6_9ORYZ|nr:hypothetical protein E2562_032822 [Oryza meyeriana var. granulata]
MGGVRLQSSSCFVRSARLVLCHGLSACRCPGTGSMTSRMMAVSPDLKKQIGSTKATRHCRPCLSGPPALVGYGAAGSEAANIHSSSSR